MENQQAPESSSPSLVNHAVKNGVILGIISVLMVIIFYVIDYSFMAGFKFVGIIMLISLGFVIYAGISYRGETGGYIAFGQAFLHGFAIMAIGGIISTIFNILLYQVVDPELGAKMTEAIISNTEEMMAGFGAPQATIDQTTEGMRAEMPSQFTIGGLLFGYVKAMIFYCIIALITALIVKKGVPVEV